MNYGKRTILLLAAMFSAAAFSYGETLTVGRGGKFKAIQPAIDAATEGDVILIKSGKYTQDDSLLISQKKDLEIRGEKNVLLACRQYVPVIYIVQSENITIRNLRAVHQVKSPEVGKGVCGPGATIITAEESLGIGVYSCELDGCGQTGFEGIASNRIVLDGNYIHDNVSSAVTLLFGEAYLEEEEPDVRIVNNRLENNFGPVVVSFREGLFLMPDKDTDKIRGVVMRKNKWKNNDRMPRQKYEVNGERVVFWGKPELMENDQGEEIISSGVLDKDTSLTVGESVVIFSGRSVVQFYESGSVSGGYAAGQDALSLPDGSTAAVERGGRLEFWETGILKSIELPDGTLLEFDEEGNPLNGDWEGEEEEEPEEEE